MTWEDFKREVEDAGVLDEDEIALVDVCYPGIITVRREEDASGALVTIT